jgi:hypothetical protein
MTALLSRFDIMYVEGMGSFLLLEFFFLPLFGPLALP